MATKKTSKLSKKVGKKDLGGKSMKRRVKGGSTVSDGGTVMSGRKTFSPSGRKTNPGGGFTPGGGN